MPVATTMAALPAEISWSGVNLILREASIGIPTEVGREKALGEFKIYNCWNVSCSNHRHVHFNTIDRWGFENTDQGFTIKTIPGTPDSADNVVFALAKDESAGNVTISDPLLNTPSSF